MTLNWGLNLIRMKRPVWCDLRVEQLLRWSRMPAKMSKYVNNMIEMIKTVTSLNCYYLSKNTAVLMTTFLAATTDALLTEAGRSLQGFLLQCNALMSSCRVHVVLKHILPVKSVFFSARLNNTLLYYSTAKLFSLHLFDVSIWSQANKWRYLLESVVVQSTVTSCNMIRVFLSDCKLMSLLKNPLFLWSSWETNTLLRCDIAPTIFTTGVCSFPSNSSCSPNLSMRQSSMLWPAPV